MLVFAYLARDSHRRVEADAMLASIDLTRAIGTEIARNLASVKLAMEATVRALQIPNIWNTDRNCATQRCSVRRTWCAGSPRSRSLTETESLSRTH